MATATHPVPLEQLAGESSEQAFCDLFDVVEDALDKLPADKRKAWLDRLSETAGKLETQA